MLQVVASDADGRVLLIKCCASSLWTSVAPKSEGAMRVWMDNTVLYVEANVIT